VNSPNSSGTSMQIFDATLISISAVDWELYKAILSRNYRGPIDDFFEKIMKTVRVISPLSNLELMESPIRKNTK
jgi:hypothetical protein